MWPDWVSNPGPLTYESDALPMLSGRTDRSEQTVLISALSNQLFHFKENNCNNQNSAESGVAVGGGGHRCNINFSNGQSIGIVLYGMCSHSLYIKGEN